MAVYIPGPESVRQVGVARDPGQSRATAQDFGAGIGEALSDFGSTVAAIGAEFYNKRKAVEDDVLEQRDELEFETGARKAYLNMQGQAGVDPENFHARVGETVNALGSELDKKYANEGIRVSPEAQQRMQARRANVLQHYTLQAVTDGHNARVVDLGRTVETNLTQIGTNLAQDGNITAASEQADRALGSLSSLVEPAEMEKARQNTNAALGQSVVSYLNTLQDEAVADKTNDGRNSYVVEGQSLIDHAVSKGWIDPADGADFKRQWEQKYQIRIVESETDPQERRRMLGDVPSRQTGDFTQPLVTKHAAGRVSAGSTAGVNPDVVNRFRAVQDAFGKPIPIISGARDPASNRRAGGAKYSQHLKGNALDLDVSDLSKEERVELIRTASANGITGIGVYDNSLHFDVGAKRAWGPSHKRGSVPAWAEAAIAEHESSATRGGGKRTILQAMEQVESGGNPNAVSPKGARGLMQVMPGTAKEIAQELGDTNFPTTGDSDIAKYLSDPAVSRRYGAHYFNKMLDRYDGDQEAALIAYNGGPARADAWLAAGRDHAKAGTPQETIEYVEKVSAAMGEGEVIATSDVEVGGEPDSFFASLPEDVRQELIAGARQDESVQRNAEIAAVKGSYQLGIETEEITSPDEILNSGLPDDDRAQLLKALETKQGDTRQLRADLASHFSGEPFDLNTYDPDEKVRANKMHTALVGAATTPEQAAVITDDFMRRYGIVPDNLTADIRRGIESKNPAEAAPAFAAAARTYEVAETAVNQMDGGKDVRDAAVAYTYFTDDLGYSAEDAAKEIIQRRSPEYQKSETVLKEKADKLVKDVKVSGLTDLFDDSTFNPLGQDPDAGFTPALEGMMLGDYREILRDKLYGEAHGDEAMAKKMANEELKAVYDVTNVNGTPTLMKFPPENFYPPVRGSHDYLREHAMLDAADAEAAAALLEIADPFLATPDTPDGMLEKGNIDLTKRPRVQNADGSVSTVRSVSFNLDGKEVLLPTVSDDGRIMSDREAIENYNRTGKHLGKFDKPENATEYAHRLHEQQDAMYTQKEVTDIYIEYVPDTADDIRAGRLPRYKFWYATEENGQNIWHEVFKDGQRQGFGFTPAEMRKVLRQEKAEKDVTDALERSRNRGVAEEMTRAQENLSRGKPNAPDRDAIIRGIEQRRLEEGYMERGLPTPGNSPPGSYVESLQEQQEKIFKDDE
jgi:hypothetical protein